VSASLSHPGFASLSTAVAAGVSVDPNGARALAEARLALATLPTLPHSIRLRSAPLAEQAAPFVAKGSRYVIDLTGFWTAPGTVGRAISYLMNHRPPPTGTAPGSYSGPVEHHGVTDTSFPEMLSYVVSSPMDQLSITYNVIADGADVAVRADIEVIWEPTKPASEYLGAVGSVDILILRPGGGTDHIDAAPTVGRTLIGPQAQTLADALDATPIDVDLLRSCPGGGTGASDVLVFHTVGHIVRIHDSVDNCGGITVMIDGNGNRR
jgi:hypothetical protein